MDIKDIEKLEALSRINLAEGEKKSLLKEMDSILAYVDQVKEAARLVSADSEPRRTALSSATSREKPLSRNIWREDNNPHESGIFTETLLASSPDRQGQYIKVKKIL